MVQKIIKTFVEKFNETPRVFRSPGRVNIIGEHTDYNDGFVLPGAIDKNIYVAVSKRNDETIKLYASGFDESFSIDATKVKRSDVQWANYVLGVVDQLHKAGCSVPGFNLVVDGEVPVGAGLSSSAAVECAVIYALNEIFNLGQEKIKMIHMAQIAEHSFAGVNCGIMDQFASMLGKKDHVIKLDCRSLEYEYVPFKPDGYKIVLLNTNVEHNLASSEYNIRRQQCEEAVTLIKHFEPQVNSLRDVNLEMLAQHVAPTAPLIYQRAKFVVEENSRVMAACDVLKNGNIKALGKIMYDAHWALSKEYEVSCKELDFLIEQVQQRPEVAGARMMGGGFGGCTINLVKEEAVEKLINEISETYQQEMKIDLIPYISVIGDGTSEALS